MSESLRQLTDAVAVLADEERVLELAVRAMNEACGRGGAFGVTSRGERSERRGLARAVANGQPIPLDPSHLAYVRTPAYDLASVPRGQRNRWVEPFREGIATPEGWKKSTLYPFVAHLGIGDFGRIAICAGERQVALLGAGVPEGAPFRDDERARLVETAAALVVPLRVAALVASSGAARSPLEQMLDASEDAVIATDGDGEIVDGSRAAFELLRVDRGLPARLRDAVHARAPRSTVLHAGERVIHLSPCRQDRVAFLAVIDGGSFAEPPVPLSERQTELLEHLSRGLTNAQIASAMDIAPSTVKTMLERLYERAGVANRVELLAWSQRRPRA